MFNFNKKDKKDFDEQKKQEVAENQKNKVVQKNTNQSEEEYILNLSKKIEAILFYKAEEVSVAFLVKFLGVKKDEISAAFKKMQENLNESPIGLVVNNQKALLVIKKEFSETISELKGEEKSGELSSSALETLSIVLYKGPISKSEIDEIRGVNSSYILRNLLVRGLVERKVEKGKTVYTETIDLMRFLGIQNKQELPGFEKVVETLNKIENTDENDVFGPKDENTEQVDSTEKEEVEKTEGDSKNVNNKDLE